MSSRLLEKHKGARLRRRARIAPAAERATSRATVAFRFALGFLVMAVITLAVWPFLPRRFYSEAKIVMLTDAQDGLPDPSKAARLYPDEAITQSQIDLISAPSLAAQVVDKCHLLEDPEFIEESEPMRFLRSLPAVSRLLPDPTPINATTVRHKLEKRLSLVRDRKSYTVSFGYWSRNPEDASAMTKALLDAFTTMQRERRDESIQRISSWLDARVQAVREQTLKSENEIRAFMDSSGLVDEGAQSDLEHELAELSTDVARTEADRVRTQVKASTLQAMKAARTVQNAPDMIASPTVQRLRDTLATALASRPNAMVPQGPVIADQINAEGDRIVAAAAIEAKDMEKRKKALEDEIHTIRLKLADRARARLHLDELKREAKADESVLETAMEKARERTDLAMSVAPEVEVDALPEPPLKPSFPNPILGIIGTLLAGLLCGAVLNWRDVAPALSLRAKVNRALSALEAS